MFDFLFSMFQKRGTSSGFSHGSGTGSLSDGLMCGRGCNIVLSENLFLSFEGGIGRKNASVVVAGGKSPFIGIRDFVEPNIVMADHSFVVIDREGVLYDRYRIYLMKCGYDLIRIDVLDKSLCLPSLDSAGDHKTAVFIVSGRQCEKAAFSVLEKIYKDLCRYAGDSAQFSQMVVSKDGEVVKTFRASSEEDSCRKKDEAEQFINCIGCCNLESGSEPNLYNFVIRSNGMTLQKSAVPERTVLRNSYVKRNPHACLPVHVEFFIPHFGKARIRDLSLFSSAGKYNISTAVILGSVSDLRVYGRDREYVAAGADTVLFLGDTDRQTEIWMEKKQDEMTARTNADGGVNLHQNHIRYTADQLHNLAKDECVAVTVSVPVFKDKKAVSLDIVQ